MPRPTGGEKSEPVWAKVYMGYAETPEDAFSVILQHLSHEGELEAGEFGFEIHGVKYRVTVER